MKTLAFGEVLWDVYESSKHIGGAPLNFCAHFKKSGGKSWILTAVGNDQLGKETVCEIEKLGVNTDYIFTVEKQTGKCLVTLDENSVPTYNLLNDVAYDYIQAPCIPNSFFDVLYFGSLALRGENNLAVLKKLISKNHFKDIFVDINIRPPFFSRETIEFAFKNATIVKISSEELPIVMEILNASVMPIKECTKAICKMFLNLRMLIITDGGNGALVYDHVNNSYYQAKAQKVKVISTVGAGDSFSAAFLANYIKNNDIQKSLEFAIKVSGYVVSCREAIPDYPQFF